MKTIQQQLCDKIYELLPHKKELEFGCELNDGSILYDIRYEPHYKENLYWFTSNTGISHRYTKNRLEENILKFGLKIIGQALRLADLLLAIETYGNFTENPFWHSDTTDYYNNKIIREYKLSQDNILKQSDELCKFCLELLK